MEHPEKQKRLEIGSVFWHQHKPRAQRSQRLRLRKFRLATMFNTTGGCINTSHKPYNHKH